MKLSSTFACSFSVCLMHRLLPHRLVSSSLLIVLSFGHYVSHDCLCSVGLVRHSRLCRCESNPLQPRFVQTVALPMLTLHNLSLRCRMKSRARLSFVVAAFACLALDMVACTQPFQCLNEQGELVDHWTIIKAPRSFQYVQIKFEIHFTEF